MHCKINICYIDFKGKSSFISFHSTGLALIKKNLETKNKITSFTFKIKIYIPFDQ